MSQFFVRKRYGDDWKKQHEMDVEKAYIKANTCIGYGTRKVIG